MGALQRGKLPRATAAPATTPTSPTSPTPPFLPRAHVSSSLTSASRRAHSTSEVLLRNACVSAQEAAVSQISASNARSSVLASYLESAVGMKRRRASDVTSNSSLSRDIHAACAARQSPPEGGQGRRLASSGSSESLESSLTRSNGRHSSRSRTRTRTLTLTLMTLISTSSTRSSTTLTTDLTFRLLLLQHNDVLFAITPYTL